MRDKYNSAIRLAYTLEIHLPNRFAITVYRLLEQRGYIYDPVIHRWICTLEPVVKKEKHLER